MSVCVMLVCETVRYVNDVQVKVKQIIECECFGLYV